MVNMDKDVKKERFVRFPHDLYDAVLSQRLTVSQTKALLYIIRRTVGFGKRSDKISISRIAKVTGYERRTMVNAIHDMEKMGMLKLGPIMSGRATEMELLSPDYWDKPVNADSHVNGDSHVNADSHPPVNVDSQVPVNVDSHLPVNADSHIKEIYKETKKRIKKKDGFAASFEYTEDDLKDGWKL